MATKYKGRSGSVLFLKDKAPLQRRNTGGRIYLKKKALFSSVALVAVVTVLVRVSGFLREVVLATVYGAGTVSDSFIVAFTVPSMALSLVGGSVSLAFIPIYTRLTQGKERFINNIMTCVALIGLVFSIVFSVVPQGLTYLFASQFDPERFLLTSRLLQAMVWSAIPLLWIGLLQGYLQIQNAFFISAIVYFPSNAVVIASIIIGNAMKTPLLLGYGAVAGHVLAMLILLLAAKKYGYTYRPLFNIHAPELRDLFLLVIPVFLSAAIGELNQIIDRNFASSLLSGSVSSLNYANKLANVIIALLGGSVMTVLFPNLSELAAAHDTERIRRYISTCIEKLLPILLPAALGMALLAEPVIRLLFEHGSFTPADTLRTAECLEIYAFLIITSAVNGILIRVFFALSDTKTPAVISGISVAVNAGLNILLVSMFKHQGLALGTVAASLLSTVLLLAAIRKRLGSLQLRSYAREWFKICAATAVMGVVVFFGSGLFPLMSDHTIVSAAATAALVFAGVASYIVTHFILRSEFAADGIELLRDLIKR